MMGVEQLGLAPADEKQRRRLHRRQHAVDEIDATTARHDGARQHPRRREQCGGRAELRTEQPDRQASEALVSTQRLDCLDEPVRERRDVDLLLVRPQQIDEDGGKSA